MNDRDDSRPGADQLLSAVLRAEEKPGRGHLKIFLGMAAGVGKTFAMLQRARQLQTDGVDVVVGWIETHGRKDTAALTEGLPLIPRLVSKHKGIAIEEMDLDAILRRRPKVVLVDELAHTNAPSSKHPKRYYDVLELLAHGIDVYSTLNVQHVESRVDTVRSITGVEVQETVPDSVLDEADEVVLIDLPPEDLLQRLRDGRIYASERAELAAKNFFTQGNLTALRELALRAATGRADRELRDFKTLHGIEAAWKSSSRFLVAVFASPYSESLIRWTRQLAETNGGSWLGAYVDTGRALDNTEKRLLEKNAELVQHLGGEFATLRDPDLVEGLLRVARQNHVTQIVVGKTQRGGLRNLLSGGSVVSRLLKRSGDIDVYAVATDRKESAKVSHRKQTRTPIVFPWGESGWAVVLVFVSWFLASYLSPHIGYQSVGIVFLITVVVSGVVFSRVSVFAIAALLSCVHNFFFIPPLYTLTIERPQDVLMHALFFVAAASVGHLTARLKNQNDVIRDREEKAVRLFQLAQAVSQATSEKEVVAAGVQALGRTFGAEVAILTYLKGMPYLLVGSSFSVSGKELAVAEWARQNGSVAGRFTDTLPSSEGTYFPLESRRVVVGVVGLRMPKAKSFDFERRQLAQGLIGQIASGLDREHLHRERQRIEILEQGERLYRALFDSVSHELKTPLTTIRGAASVLTDPAVTSVPASIADLAGQIGGQTDRLLAVVENMLDMTRLESGAVQAKVATYDIADVVGPALKRVEPLLGKRTLDIALDRDVQPLRCDAPLLVQALVNILANAITYGAGTIFVSARNLAGKRVEIRVRDEGPGLPGNNPAIVFDKFYRQSPERSGGVGLGLSIAKGFLEAQAGELTAENDPRGGATFSLRLPSAKEEA